jgi:hypothetical protein
VRGFAAVLVLVVGVPAGVAAERAIELSGSIGVYDPATIPVWPERIQLVTGGADKEGALLPEARRRAGAAHNPARFLFYMSLAALDGGCDCNEQYLLERLRREHPEVVLRDEHGEPVSIFLDRLKRGRMPVMDLGNTTYTDAWADRALAEVAKHGWDGVWVDNVFRGRLPDENWSAVPVNPRTQRPYTVPEYRADMLAALERLRRRFDAGHVLFVGNHASAWRSFDEDPIIGKQVLAMHGVQLEDFAFTLGGAPHPEADWLRQLGYLDFANRHGVLTWTTGGGGALMDPAKREYVLASYLLTRRGRSVVGDLNALKTWWPALATDLGGATGDFACLDPGADYRPTDPCPAPGRVFVRDFAKARVVVNPGNETRHVPLGARFRTLDGAAAEDPLPLAPHAGRVLLRDGDHTASRTSSGRVDR